jgi:serine protease AprX
LPIEIPNALVEFILLGPADDRRQLQDSPILGDVWGEFARRPDARLDLLITPFMLEPAGAVAVAINRRYKALGFEGGSDAKGDPYPNIAFLQGIVAARLSFLELLRVVVPMTAWWQDRNELDKDGSIIRSDLDDYGAPDTARPKVEALIASAKAWRDKVARRESPAVAKPGAERAEFSSLDRYIMLAGLILWALDQEAPARSRLDPDERTDRILSGRGLAAAIVKKLTEQYGNFVQDIETIKLLRDEAVKKAGGKPSGVPAGDKPLVWQVSLNRAANPALMKSVPAVKADAARSLFSVETSAITWAIIDSGIDGGHPAFQKSGSANANRVKKSFDFKNFRRIVSLSNETDKVREANVKLILEHTDLKIHQSETPAQIEESAHKDLLALAEDAQRGPSALHWHLVERYVEIIPTAKPVSGHGTHVAGILGASKECAQQAANVAASMDPAAKRTRGSDIQDGMCPDINFFDFRVIGPEIVDTEFAIIGVLQYIRYLNDRDTFLTIHGANLSLSIPHDVRNFACGRTPICNECERLVESGVVVVAAAGNHGYKSFHTKEGAFDGYAAFSITDPGNADGVITVGATHRNWPHTYGISFFSSRGPTGDGRLKPDLVAPGERIRSTLPGGEWGDLDGTSQAAPHVSGAAAMLMARYSELIGQPRRIKKILCESATDLGRERTFQGHGMLDVLRAFQKI